MSSQKRKNETDSASSSDYEEEEEEVEDALVTKMREYTQQRQELISQETNQALLMEANSAVPAVSELEKHPWLSPSQMEDFYNMGQVGDANLLFALYSNPKRLLFDKPEQAWYHWNGNHWEQDRVLLVDLVIRTCIYNQYKHWLKKLKASNNQSTVKQENVKKRMNKLCTIGYLNGVMSLATAKFIVSEWNHPPYVLPVRNGVINLKLDSVRFQPSHPDQMVKFYAPTDWKGIDAPAERWKLFMEEVYHNSNPAVTQAVIAYVQRLFGFMIAGHPAAEEAVLLFHGEGGRSGRSTMFGQVMPHVLGEKMVYHVSPDVVVQCQAARAGSTQNHLVALRDTRIAYLSETEKNAKLNISQLKRLSGNDPITARANYKAPVSWKPTQVLCLLTNYKPDLSNCDDRALWERVHLIPHTQRFINEPKLPNEHMRDPHLAEKLIAESSGILAWLVQGCLMWQKCGGLHPPEVIKLAKAQYQSDSNHVQEFFTSVPRQAKRTRIQAMTLYAVYKTWCEKKEKNSISPNLFGKTAKQILGTPIKTNGGKRFYESDYQFNIYSHGSDGEE